ncbi:MULTISPECIES: glutaredoxin domain-containing protein [unclassified Duganella]|uniref:glutaredoxin family protein n=1 Tax=unclassified Duganella TaxID=2636909 RepID=UPI000A7BBC3E|nr:MULTISPECIES: glutaredoxin domain-containing protein [unclassified Duganella]
MIKHLKTLGMYALILAAGLAVGVAVAKVPALFKKDFVQGDYSAYLTQHKAQVVLYGTETCPYCAKARAYFKENGIAYADLDVGKPGESREEFKKLGGKNVPLLLIGERRIDGFNVAVIHAALKADGRAMLGR